MEAPDVPTEHLHEEIHEHAHGAREKWQLMVAIATAVMAGFAAVASLLAAENETKAMIEQIQASDRWAYFQAKGIKSGVVSAKFEERQAMGKIVDPKNREALDRYNAEQDPKDQATIDRYKSEQDRISGEAKALQASSKAHLEVHEALAHSVTMFQISIVIAAISMVVKRKEFFFGSLLTTAVGLFFFSQQCFPSKEGHESHENAAEHAAATPGESAKH